VLESTKTFLKTFLLEQKDKHIHIVNKKQEYFLGDKIMRCKQFQHFKKLNESYYKEDVDFLEKELYSCLVK